MEVKLVGLEVSTDRNISLDQGQGTISTVDIPLPRLSQLSIYPCQGYLKCRYTLAETFLEMVGPLNSKYY